ncbi:MAG: hypothetical protein V1793_09525 [Pseudomonadota bacterium]
MSVKKDKLTKGIVLLVTFTIVLAIMFMPVFGTKNGLSYLDDLYNSMSKGSAYYVPAIQKEVAAYTATRVALELKMDNAAQAVVGQALLTKAGASVTVNDIALKFSGDLPSILNACLADADLMYHNDGVTIQSKYGSDERLAVYTWYQILKKAEKALVKDKLFKDAKIVASVNHKTVEAAYNYYRIEPRTIGGSAGILIFSLVFYVIYTLWYGFGIMFLFEGIGMQLEH